MEDSTVEELEAELEAVEESIRLALIRKNKANGGTSLVQPQAPPCSGNAAKEQVHAGETTNKFRGILEHIPPLAKSDTEEAVEYRLGPNVTLIVGNKAKLASVTPAQYMAANACILAALLLECSPDKHQLLARDYMAHTTKVAELATVYTWKSVIAWDHVYRQHQYRFGFRWGSDSAYFNPVQLVRRKNQKPKQKKSTKAAKSKAPKRPPPACLDWNKDAPCRSSACKFRHECAWCGSVDHPSVRHDKALQARVPERANC